MRIKKKCLVLCIFLAILLLSTGCVFTRCAAAAGRSLFEALTDGTGSEDADITFQDDGNKPPHEDSESTSKNNGDGIVDEIWNSSNSSYDTEGGIEGNSSYQAEHERIDFVISYFIKAYGNTDRVEFLTSIPRDYKYRQKIHGYSFSTEPDDMFLKGENYYARFLIENPAEEFSFKISVDMDIYDFGMNIAGTVGDNYVSEKTALLKYKEEEQFIEKNDPYIKEIAGSFKSTGQADLINQLYNYVLDNMQYTGYNPSSVGAAGAIAAGGGDCTEYSDLFVALCRAKGIPARTVEGYTTDASPSEISMGHNWSEVYLDDYGWVPFDTIYDDNNGDSWSTTFDNLSNIYVYTGFERNDAVLYNYHYYAYTYYGDDIEVTKTISVN